MRRKVLIRYLSLCCLVAVFLSYAPADPPARLLTRPLDLKRRQATEACPKVFWADYGSYQMWYGVKCNAMMDPCMISTTMGGPGKCGVSDPKCVTLTLLTVKAGLRGDQGNHLAHSSIEAGKPKVRKSVIDAKPNYPIEGTGIFHATRAAAPVFVKLQTKPGQAPADYASVMLFLNIVVPGLKTPMLAATGVEVDPEGATPTVDPILNSSLTHIQGKVCWVRYGGLTYQVVLDENRGMNDPEMPREAAKKGR